AASPWRRHCSFTLFHQGTTAALIKAEVPWTSSLLTLVGHLLLAQLTICKIGISIWLGWPDVLKRKTAPLLDEYFSLRLLDETLKCIGELKSGLSILKLSKRPFPWIEQRPPCVEPVAKLLEYLLADKVFTKGMGTGSFLHAALLDDLA
ncbi:eukaryotic translation initiation factor-like, partial [Olea europaea subsp. europaea]